MVTVFITNQTPIATDDYLSHATSATTVDVLKNDSDTDADSLTISAVGSPAHGTATINGGANITYTPSAGVTTGTDQFSYTISDGHGGTSTAIVSVAIDNQTPVAADDAVSHATAAVTVSVLDNDYDPDVDTLTLTAVGSASHGTAAVSGNNVTYTPSAGVTIGTDSFTYTISDGHSGMATATVSVAIGEQAPIANDDGLPHATAAVTASVLANDGDPDADALTVTTVSTPAHGTAAISGNNVVYTPIGGTTAATDFFTYTVSDGHGGSRTATVSVFLTNQAPTAYDDLLVHATAAVTADLTANDFDPDYDALTVTTVGTPAHGTATINGDISVTYTPTVGTTAATDSFTYVISDGHGSSSTGTVSVNLTNNAPVATSVSLPHVTAAVTAFVLDNVTDADYDAFTVTAVGTPAHGTAVINADNSVRYTPDVGTTATTDAFAYTVSDGHTGSATATVSVFLANRVPVATADSGSTHSAAITIGVLANDTDADGDALTITAVGSPARGTAAISGNSVIYTPSASYSVNSDSFTYTISDGQGGSSTGTVSVTLTNNAPVAAADSAVHVSAAVTLSVLANDTDANSDSLTITAVGSPANGTATISGSNVVYTPSGTAATDSFTYSISDGHGGAATGTVSIYRDNRGPTAVNDSANAHNAVTVYVLANDSDADGDSLTVTSLGGILSHGTASINGDNTVTYTPNAGATGTDSFTYTISDGHGGSSTATLTITLVNQAPSAADDTITVAAGVATSFSVLSNDSDPDGDSLTITAVGMPLHGMAWVDGSGHLVWYQDPGTTDTSDFFTYTISDGHGGTSTATISLTITH